MRRAAEAWGPLYITTYILCRPSLFITTSSCTSFRITDNVRAQASPGAPTPLCNAGVRMSVPEADMPRRLHNLLRDMTAVKPHERPSVSQVQQRLHAVYSEVLETRSMSGANARHAYITPYQRGLQNSCKPTNSAPKDATAESATSGDEAGTQSVRGSRASTSRGVPKRTDRDWSRPEIGDVTPQPDPCSDVDMEVRSDPRMQLIAINPAQVLRHWARALACGAMRPSWARNHDSNMKRGAHATACSRPGPDINSELCLVLLMLYSCAGGNVTPSGHWQPAL